MALQFAHGTVQWIGTHAAGTQYAVTGLPFRPKAIRFYYTGIQNTVDYYVKMHSRRGVGFCAERLDGSFEQCTFGTLDRHNEATAQICVNATHYGNIAILTLGTPAIVGSLAVQSINNSGFVLQVTLTQVAQITNTTISWEAWGDDDEFFQVSLVTGMTEPSFATEIDYDIGFKPDVIMTMGVNTTAYNAATGGDAGLCTGFATSAFSSDNIALCGYSRTAVADSRTSGMHSEGACLLMCNLTPAAPTAVARISALTQRGFKLTWTTVGVYQRRYAALCIKSNGGKWFCGPIRTNGNINAWEYRAYTPFAPIGVTMMARGDAGGGLSQSWGNDRVSWGSCDGSYNKSLGVMSVHGVATSDVGHTVRYSNIIGYPSGTGWQAGFYVSALESNAFLVVTVGTGGSAGEFLSFLAFGHRRSENFNNYKHVSAIDSSGVATSEKIR